MIHNALSDPSVNNAIPDGELAESCQDRKATPSEERSQRSRLIEFPGVRAIPEWRKQLSQRVREVQERKAREAAEELAAAQEAGTVSFALPSAQLELIPDLEQPVMNPIVTKALERLERARRTDYSTLSAGTAAAPALEPAANILTVPEEMDSQSTETKPRLTVVTPSKPPAESNDLTPKSEPAPRKTVRVISDDVEDMALSYLETCLNVPALASDTRRDQAGFARRIFAGILDLLMVALMVSPLAAAIEFDHRIWSDPRVIGVTSGMVVVTMFAYMTISIALTGRTLGMRLLSLRAIDVRTGLIPTGGQSIKRAIAHIFSLALLGLGLIYCLFDRDRRTVSDRFSKTLVIRT